MSRLAAITGARGWLGSSVQRYFQEKGWEVAGLVRAPGHAGERRFVLGEEPAPDLLADVDALVHCAYDFQARGRTEIERVNVRGTETLFRAAARAGVRRLVYISSMSAFPGCRSLYGLAKLAAEEIAAAHGALIVRPGLITGAGAGGMVGSLVKQVRGKLVPLIAADAVLYAVHERDLAGVIFRFCDSELAAPLQPVITAHPEPWSFRRLLAEVARREGQKPVFVPVPWRAVWLGLRLAEALGLRLGFRSDSVVSLANQDPQPDFPLLPSWDFTRVPLTPATLPQRNAAGSSPARVLLLHPFFFRMQPIELTVVMPCLNEAETVARCIDKAKLGFERAGLRGEVIVADNGSTDGSQRIAEEHGARVVLVAAKGYGSALRGGLEAAQGEYMIMGDADDSYDFSESGRFVAKLREGYDLVMGCRLPSGGGTIAPGAMPWKNRWLGNPVLSFIGRLFFRTPVRDFHCGLRAFSRAGWERMTPSTTGMEFASEMVMKASILQLRIAEVPITLHKDGRSRPPHLRPWRDGWRHLRFMLIYSPRWLFLVPGLVLSAGGAAAALWCSDGLERHLTVNGALTGLTVSCAAMVAGVQLVAAAFYTKVFGTSEGLMPEDRRFTRIFRLFTLERGLAFGVFLLLGGVAVLVRSWMRPPWSQPGLVDPFSMRDVIAASTLLMLGVEVVFSSFFMSVLGLKTINRRPPDPTSLPA